MIVAGGSVWWEAQGFVKVGAESFPSSVFSTAKLSTGHMERKGAETARHTHGTAGASGQTRGAGLGEQGLAGLWRQEVGSRGDESQKAVRLES